MVTALNRLTICVNGENVLFANCEKDKLHFSIGVYLHPSSIPSLDSFMSSDLTKVSKNNEVCLTKNNLKPLLFHSSLCVSFLFSESSHDRSSSVYSDATNRWPVVERGTFTSQPVNKTARAKTRSLPVREYDSIRSSSD
jgi:hypothetical protein